MRYRVRLHFIKAQVAQLDALIALLHLFVYLVALDHNIEQGEIIIVVEAAIVLALPKAAMTLYLHVFSEMIKNVTHAQIIHLFVVLA